MVDEHEEWIRDQLDIIRSHEAVMREAPGLRLEDEKGKLKRKKTVFDRIRYNPRTGKPYPLVLTDTEAIEMNAPGLTEGQRELAEERLDYIRHVTLYAVDLLFPDPDRHTVNLEGLIYTVRHLRVDENGKQDRMPYDYIAGELETNYSKVRRIDLRATANVKELIRRITFRYPTMPHLNVFHVKELMRKNGIVFSAAFKRQLLQERKDAVIINISRKQRQK